MFDGYCLSLSPSPLPYSNCLSLTLYLSLSFSIPSSSSIVFLSFTLLPHFPISLCSFFSLSSPLPPLSLSTLSPFPPLSLRLTGGWTLLASPSLPSWFLWRGVVGNSLRLCVHVCVCAIKHGCYEKCMYTQLCLLTLGPLAHTNRHCLMMNTDSLAEQEEPTFAHTV